MTTSQDEPLPALAALSISLPDWVSEYADFGRGYHDDDERMALAIGLAHGNVEHNSGGPFGAAIFDEHSGHLISVGVNRVLPLNNCTLHAEMLAFMFGQTRLSSHTFRQAGQPTRTLYTSCSPCAMCLGASLWSGVSRIVIAARRDDAQAIGFEEGPVFPASEIYLQERGIVIEHDRMREEGRAVLQRYAQLNRLRYNG